MSALDTRDDLRELAEHYETVASLDLTPDPSGVRGVPGSRVPPGAQAILDADEVKTALGEIDEWAMFLVHVLVDERDAPCVGMTPAILRHVGEWAGHFLDHDDEGLRLAFADDLKRHSRNLSRLASRALRFVRTGTPCQDPTCTGQYVADLPRVGKPTAGDITCDRCKHKVPHSVWSSWPRARVEWVTVEHAARIAGVSVAAVKMRASRLKWRRQGVGREVKYYLPHVRGEQIGAPEAYAYAPGGAQAG